ncbi:hypothetical protein ACFOY2_28970 [Nonomuraea purpurea]|uniref:Uncharacterized protein n=1 Tax=Nonomuraea purpurea TaxID=1849276 RepID=A0ABV8GEZ0_9ACTN
MTHPLPSQPLGIGGKTWPLTFVLWSHPESADGHGKLLVGGQLSLG